MSDKVPARQAAKLCTWLEALGYPDARELTPSALQWLFVEAGGQRVTTLAYLGRECVSTNLAARACRSRPTHFVSGGTNLVRLFVVQECSSFWR